MLRKSNKDFCKSLKISCRKSSVLNTTLKKYYLLKKRIIAQRKKLLDGGINKTHDFYADSIVNLIDDFTRKELTINECFLLLAIFGNSDKFIANLVHEYTNFDVGFSALLYCKFA